jgi:thiamine-monophosphate kinase
MVKESVVWDIAQTLLMPAGATGDDCFHEKPDPAATLLSQQIRLYSVDTFVEEQHFSFQFCTPYEVGWRTLAASLSDIAACGGKAVLFMVSLVLPTTTTEDDIEGFYSGMKACLKASHCTAQLVGGDTVKGDQWVVSVTVVGEAPSSLKRNQAKAGDYLIATGHHGLSHLGLRLLQQNAKADKSFLPVQHFLKPLPKLEAGQALQAISPTSALMDSSDGLADACLKIAHASGVQVLLNQDWLPIASPFMAYGLAQAQGWILYGGEDFELVGTIRCDVWHANLTALKRLGFRVHGWVVEATVPSAWLVSGETVETHRRLEPLSADKTFQHFT